MASAVYTEPPASRLSISLEGSASTSPFPSPSSSFLPPPTPGAHEFAVKPAPPARSGSGGRKSSNPQPSPHRPLLSSPSDPHNGDASLLARQCDGTDVAGAEKTKSRPTSSSLPSSASQQQRASLNGLQVPYAHTNEATEHPTNSSTSTLPIPASPSLVSPVTPTPYSIQRHPSPPPVSEGDNAAMLDPPWLPAPSAHAREGSSSTTTPTKQSSSLPPESVQASASALASTSSSSTESPVAPAPAATAVAAAAAAEPPELPLSKIIIPDLDQSTLTGGEQSSGSVFSSAAESTSTSKSRSRPPSSALSAISTTNADPSLFSNRPAPPSPISRRVSKAYSASSARSRSSRPPSTSVSRANSVRKNNANANANNTTGNAGTSTGSSARGSPVIQPNANRQSIGGNQLVPPLPSPHNLVFALTSISTNSNFNANANSALTPTPTPCTTSPPVSAAATVGSGNSLPVTPATATPSSSSLSQAQAQSQAQKRASVITTTTAKVYIKIRDYAYPPADERHVGLGPDVPKANKVVRLNRRLGPRTLSQMSAESREGDDEVDEDGDEGGQLDGFRIGLGRLGLGMGMGMGMGAGGVFRAWGTGAGGYGATAADIIERDSKAGGAYPSRSEMDINFLEGSEGEGGYYTSEGYEEEYDPASALEGEGEGEDGEEEEDILYPGLYRALYAFEPEGTAEMRLEEDQLVHVVGRGGGVGWAVVIDEKGTSELVAANGNGNGNAASGAAPKHALVPESYLEPVRLDWEDEQEGLGVGAADATSA